jgi:hypothetical protein
MLAYSGFNNTIRIAFCNLDNFSYPTGFDGYWSSGKVGKEAPVVRMLRGERHTAKQAPKGEPPSQATLHTHVSPKIQNFPKLQRLPNRIKFCAIAERVLLGRRALGE